MFDCYMDSDELIQVMECRRLLLLADADPFVSSPGAINYLIIAVEGGTAVSNTL